MRDDLHHPSVNFERIHGKKPLYSARVNQEYRALGYADIYEDEEVIVCSWIGHHTTYDKLINQR